MRRHRSAGTAAELVGADCSASVRVRRRTAAGLDVEVTGTFPERELVVLVAGYDLLR